MPVLTGDKVLLRPYRAADAEMVLTWANDPETTQYLSPIFWFPYGEAMSEDFVHEMMKPSRERAAFVIADPATGEYWGQIDLFAIDWQYRRGEVGVVLARADQRGRGVGTQALELLCAYAFETLGLHRVELDVHGDNPRAIRCYSKAGFVREGVRRRAVFKQGKWVDLVEMAVVADEWLERRNADV